MRGKIKKNRDPLFQLFEYFLLNRSYEDTTTFTKDVAEEYLAYIDSTQAHVPFHCRQSVVQDLENEAHEMLVKKMYGVRAGDFSNFGKVLKLTAGDELEPVEFDAPSHNEEQSKK
ncbi:MAG: hypothetical protein HY537_12095 [Deltaproteobacteria bacterium]|nr:hypothetical protein [Deltaproteobacteria bacterium]